MEDERCAPPGLYHLPLTLGGIPEPVALPLPPFQETKLNHSCTHALLPARNKLPGYTRQTKGLNTFRSRMGVRVNSSGFVLPLLKLGQGLPGTSRAVARGIYAKVSDIVPDMYFKSLVSDS